MSSLISNLVLLQLIFNVLLDFLFVLSYRIHKYPLARNADCHTCTSDLHVCRKL